MTPAPAITLLDTPDADLVAQSLAGSHQAFGQIVARYQSLLCSLAFSATGSLHQSEDLAQEAFVAAWRQLRELREPAKLRPWLCTIARHLAFRSQSRESRQPTHAAQPLDALHETPAHEPPPNANAISREEESLLWRSLETIPESYREPMVLFYREHQSVEGVAEALDLTPDTVRQRLFRGRKMLAEHVTAFVEGALERTVPGPAFTQSVMSALPFLALSTKGAAFGSAAVKTGFLSKALLGASWLGVILGPILGLFGAWFGVQSSIACARSPRERQFITRSAWITASGALIFTIALYFVVVAMEFWEVPHAWGVAAFVGLPLVYAGFVFFMALSSRRTIRRIRAEDGTLQAPSLSKSFSLRGAPFEYRSSWSVFGLPVLHICTGPFPDGRRGLAKGWIAIGDAAIGLVAIGGLSVGVISLGGVSAGLLAIGGVALAPCAFGGFALGWWAVGGLAIGIVAYGGSAIAWDAASGGFAIAHQYASGGFAQAAHVHDASAIRYFDNNAFFQIAEYLMRYAILLVWLPMGLVLWQAVRILKNFRREKIGPPSPRS